MISQILSDSTPIYRILAFDRAVEIFERKEIHLSHPSVWEDPYETQLQHKLSSAIFAGCWCKNAASDAMWRIYSPSKLSVRISTTVGKLNAEISKAQKEASFAFMIGSVAYESQAQVIGQLRDIAMQLGKRFDSKTAAKALLLKRKAFEHESEVRVIVYARDRPHGQTPQDGYKMAIDPNTLISGILVDPRAPSQFVDAYAHYFVNALKFDKPVRRSQLYASKAKLNVQGDGEA